MKQVFTHHLSHEQAHEVAERALQSYRDRFSDYDSRIEWRDGNRAHIEVETGDEKIVGQVELLDGELILTLNMPEEYTAFDMRDDTIFEHELREQIDRAHEQRS